MATPSVTSDATRWDRPLNTSEVIKFPTIKSDTDTRRTMKALEWVAPKKVRVVSKGKPLITDPDDAIIRVTSTTVCGSDLHLYHGEVLGMEKGDVLGHECMGIVEEIGPNVKHLKPGDRVVVSAVIMCGKCWFCKKNLPSLCDTTNPSKEMDELYGSRLSGIFGYSHLTGGYDGGQAEYVRVPYADNGCLKVPSHLPDEKVLFLSDIVCTGWHANELAEVQRGDTVAVWGCGPVGLMALAWAKFRGAARIIAIDMIPFRLNLAMKHLGAEVINAAEQNVVKTLKALVPGGPDVCIEAAGFRYAKSTAHTVLRALHLETDAPDILTEAITAIRKGGRMAIIGDYFGNANNFPIGPMMEKGLTIRGSQVYVQRYWKELLGYIERGEFDPTFVITHTFALEQIDKAYKMFDEKADNIVKVFVITTTSPTQGSK